MSARGIHFHSVIAWTPKPVATCSTITPEPRFLATRTTSTKPSSVSPHASPIDTSYAGTEPVVGARHPAVQRLLFFLSESPPGTPGRSTTGG
ncbi:hypothetical protein ADK54_20145 [Streptomyces sp. WM6378]|nr:hypothetical protein ADK54_20145 [Streptomyces sp. WM6378]